MINYCIIVTHYRDSRVYERGIMSRPGTECMHQVLGISLYEDNMNERADDLH